MWTLVAFGEHRTEDAWGEIAAVRDESHKTHDDDLFVGKWNRLIGLAAMGKSIQEAYLISPSLRRVSRIYAYPVIQYLSYDMNFVRRFDDRKDCPLVLASGEALNSFNRTSEFSDTYADMMGVWLADAPVVPKLGEVHTVKFVSTDLAVQNYLAHVWHNEEITFTPDLPVGRYAIVGARCHANWTGFFRFVSRESAHRPGGILTDDRFWIDDEVFHHGRLGTWLEFDSVLPPSLDVCQARDEALTDVFGNIDLIKIA